MKKEHSTYKRLLKSKDIIKVDYENDASISFLSRKFYVARATMKEFLQMEGIYDK